jgi:hypothetical protein
MRPRMNDASLTAFIEAANMAESLPAFTDPTNSLESRLQRTKLIRSLTKTQRNYLGPEVNTAEFRDRYDALKLAQGVLPLIAEHSDVNRDDFAPGDGVMGLPPISVNIYSDCGVFAASGHFTNAFGGIPLNRIRSCPICKQVFMAQRANSSCCGTRCRKAYNQRLFRMRRKNAAMKKSNLRKGQ